MGRANYADIMNAPTGEGFRNRPRGVGLPEPVATVKEASPVLKALETGTATDSRPLGDGGNANTSVIVTLNDGTEAVYKPEIGENWTASFSNHDISEYVTNRDFSLAEREAIAYEISQHLGIDFVPETVHRKEMSGSIDIDASGDDEGGGYDEDYAREQYAEYEERAREDAYEAVGGEMGDLYREAQREHFDDIESRAEELREIWNEEVENLPVNPAGTGSALREHPVLPLGSKGPFERRETQGRWTHWKCWMKRRLMFLPI